MNCYFIDLKKCSKGKYKLAFLLSAKKGWGGQIQILKPHKIRKFVILFLQEKSWILDGTCNEHQITHRILLSTIKLALNTRYTTRETTIYYPRQNSSSGRRETKYADKTSVKREQSMLREPAEKKLTSASMFIAII